MRKNIRPILTSAIIAVRTW